MFRLYYHPESDALFWDDVEPADGLCDDVTVLAAYQDAAVARGIKCPGLIANTGESSWTEMIEQELEKQKTGGLAGAIQKSYKKWERKPSDFYPTPYDGTNSLIPVLKTAFPDGARVWEPCCGDMDMTRVLEWHGFEVTSSDIRDTGQGIGGFDFLNDDPAAEWGWVDNPDLICLNPPFSLAYDFIEKALSYTPNVACLLKIDYWNAISRYELFQRKRPMFFFPLTWRLAFLKEERGNSPLMNCAWAVWLDDEYRSPGHDDVCIFEPMKKWAYPGYQSDGLRTKLAKYGQALDELTEVTSVATDNRNWIA